MRSRPGSVSWPAPDSLLIDDQAGTPTASWPGAVRHLGATALDAVWARHPRKYLEEISQNSPYFRRILAIRTFDAFWTDPCNARDRVYPSGEWLERAAWHAADGLQPARRRRAAARDPPSQRPDGKATTFLTFGTGVTNGTTRIPATGRPLRPAKHDVAGWFISEKLDGTRCFWDGGMSRGVRTEDVPWASVIDPKTGKQKAKIKPWRPACGAATATRSWPRTGC